MYILLYIYMHAHAHAPTYLLLQLRSSRDARWSSWCLNIHRAAHLPSWDVQSLFTPALHRRSEKDRNKCEIKRYGSYTKVQTLL